jgi:hypothetical protein
MADECVKGEVFANIDGFNGRLERVLTLTAPKSLSQSFVSHAVAAPAFWAVQQNAVVIKFVHA